MKDYKQLVENAPILEYDNDSAEFLKDRFFATGKKPFKNFDKVKKLGITKCIFFLPRDFRKLTTIYKKCKKIYEFKSASSCSPVYLYANKVLIALCPLGGPSSANLMEELEHVGIKTIIACGTCGCINPDVNIESYFIPTEAIRDEGLSYHYLPASRTVRTSAKINSAIKQVLQNNNETFVTGKIWTIDAMYRETPNRITRRVNEGSLAVDMECASLSACAKFNNIKFGQLLYFTDRVSSTNWEWRFYDKIKIRTHLIELCLQALELL